MRGAPLVAMHVWPPVGDSDRYGFGHVRPEAEDRLAASVELWADKHPEVPVLRVLRHGVDVAIAITAASHAAQLVVVGTARGMRWTGRATRSVSESLAGRAGCPVVVVALG